MNFEDSKDDNQTNNDMVSFAKKYGIHIQYEAKAETHIYTPDICVTWNNRFQTLEEIKGFVKAPKKFEAKMLRR